MKKRILIIAMLILIIGTVSMSLFACNPVAESHNMVWVRNDSLGHYMKCNICNYTTSFVAHDYIIVNGVTKCGSCGYNP